VVGFIYVTAAIFFGFFPVLKVAITLYIKVSVVFAVCYPALKIVVLCSSRVAAAVASHLCRSSGTLSSTDGWAVAPSE
jgi:type III secretory pathway component EscR